MPSIEQTLGNQSWTTAHRQQLRDLFPIEPVKVSMELFLSVGFKLKLMGVDWRDQNDLPKMFSFLQRIELVDIKTFQGETYVLQHLSAEERAAYVRTQSLQKSAERINRTEPTNSVKDLVSSYLNKFKKS